LSNQRYQELSGNQHVKNMLNLIAQAEGTTKHGYNTNFGGSSFEDLNDHPRVSRPFTQTDGKQNQTTAAGRYQFLSSTWDDARNQLGLADFSGPNQDIAATFLMDRAGALDDVLRGDYKTATDKLGPVWASLPSSKYSQPKRSEGFIESAINALVPNAHAGTLPQTTAKLSGEQMNNLPNGIRPEQVNVNVNNQTMLPAAMAALLGRYAAPGGDFRSQDAQAIAPEAIQSIQNMRETKAKMLPIAMGALMSSNTGANNFGQSMIGPAMTALDPLKMQNGLVTPDGQYITDVDNSSYMRNLASMGKGSDGRTISVGELSKFNDKLGTYAQLDSLSKDFKDDFTTSLPFEAVGDAQNMIGKKLGLGYEKQANFWMGYQETINKIRNEMFGSALTETERGEFEKAIVRPGMDAKTIRFNITRQSQIVKSALERQSLIFKDSGYDTRGMNAGLDRATNVQISNVPDAGGSGGNSESMKPLSDEELDKKYGG
jgi:muramidase (phage lysozyme)